MALAQQQEALLDALFAWPPQSAMKNLAAQAIDPGARGLKAYQTNGHMLAERALTAAYPVVAQLLGGESFGDLARALWHGHPPLQGDLALWGDALPAFLHISEQLQEEPYLPDVARAEWALHCAATAADVQPDPASLALLTTHDPAQLQLVLAPGCVVVESKWPLASLLLAHLQGQPSLAEAGAQVRARLPQEVVVWREGLRARVREAVPGEALCLRSVVDGQTLAHALDKAPQLDFSSWFPMAIQTALVLGVVFTGNARLET
jgi:hypothetical protein